MSLELAGNSPNMSEPEQQDMFENAKITYPEAYADPQEKGVFWELRDSSGLTEEAKYTEKLILVRWHDDSNVTGGGNIRTNMLCQKKNGDYYSITARDLLALNHDISG